MKRILITLLAAAAVLVSGCATSKSVPDRLESLVKDAEENADYYTKKDWDQTQYEYESLIDEYTENFENYTPAERRKATEAIGRYHAILIKNGLHESIEVIKQIKDIAPSYFNGMVKEFAKDTGAMKESIRDLLDTTNLFNSLRELGSIIESFINDETIVNGQ